MQGFKSLGIAIATAIGIALAGIVAAEPADDFRAGRDAYGRGDVRSAISILKKSADAGHAPSQALVGEILAQSMQGEEALKYYRLAAAQGDADAQHGLAVMYASGDGVPRDLATARQWMTRAGEAGHRQSIQAMALAYMGGGLDVADGERTSAAALAWIGRAAANDFPPAIDRLAAAYRQGEFGLAPDVRKAEELEARSRALRKIVPGKGGRKGAKANG